MMARLERHFTPEPNTGCWLWHGSRTRLGYGQTWKNGRGVYAHRAMMEEVGGHIPEGQCVLHRCDTPECVNPDHLFVGTMADNTADMVNKGRSVPPPIIYGVSHHAAKLADSEVTAIRAVYAVGLTSLAALARKYQVTKASIHRIVNRKAWRHL